MTPLAEMSADDLRVLVIELDNECQLLTVALQIAIERLGSAGYRRANPKRKVMAPKLGRVDPTKVMVE